MSRSTPWVLVVVRAWLEPEGTRIRLLRDDSDGRWSEETVSTPRQAGAVVEEWVEQLRRSEDGGVDGDSLGSPGDHGRHP